MKPEDRIPAIETFFSANGQKLINPDTQQPTWVYCQRELDDCLDWHKKENMFTCREFKETGYLSVNMQGRCGWKLLPIACGLEDYPLIDYLLDQGASRESGCDYNDLRGALRIHKVDEDRIERTLKYIESKAPIPDMYWLSRVLVI